MQKRPGRAGTLVSLVQAQGEIQRVNVLSVGESGRTRWIGISARVRQHGKRMHVFCAELTWVEWAEVLSYVVTIFGFPMAIAVFLYEQRKERRNEQEEIYQRLSDEYASFLRLALDNADLHLLRRGGEGVTLNEEQAERKFTIFNILVSLFERAYILVYDDEMDRQTRRLWQSWEDYMREWCRRPDFRAALKELLRGEDEDFAGHIMKIAEAESQGSGK
jgi:hypothetical protein